MAETQYFPLLGSVVALTPDWKLQIFDDALGLWLTLAQADEEAEMVRAGIPTLRGPYVVDVTDLATEGASKTLWTPTVGDVLLRLVVDIYANTDWDSGNLYIGQSSQLVGSGWIVKSGGPTTEGYQLDLTIAGYNQAGRDAAGVDHYSTAYVFHSTDPVQIKLADTGGTDPTAGHLQLYALVAQAVAP